MPWTRPCRSAGRLPRPCQSRERRVRAGTATSAGTRPGRGDRQRGTGSYLLGRARGGGWQGGLRPALGGTRSARAEGSRLPPHRGVAVPPPQSTPGVVVLPPRGMPGVVVLLPEGVLGVVVPCRARPWGAAGDIGCGRTQLSPSGRGSCIWFFRDISAPRLSWDRGSGDLQATHTESLNQSGSKRPLVRKIIESNL